MHGPTATAMPVTTENHNQHFGSLRAPTQHRVIDLTHTVDRTPHVLSANNWVIMKTLAGQISRIETEVDGRQGRIDKASEI